MEKLKRKFLSADTKEEKTQILTLVPHNWSRSRAANFFNTSEYFMRLTRETKCENAILGIPMPIHRYGLTTETIENVINFYESGEISRICPGKKHYVTDQVQK